MQPWVNYLSPPSSPSFNFLISIKFFFKELRVGDTHNEAKTKERASAEWTRGEGHEAAGMTMTEQGDVRNRGHQKHRQAQGSWQEDKD